MIVPVVDTIRHLTIVTMSTMAAEQSEAKFIPGENNRHSVKCTKCNCLLLRPDHGTFVSFQIELPLPTIKKDQSGDSGNNQEEVSKELIEVLDIFTFENMGFSHSVNGKKFLVCADCEWGPIGYQDLDTNKSYISLPRIKLD